MSRSDSKPLASRDEIQRRITDSMARWHGAYEAEKRPLSAYLCDELADLFALPGQALAGIGEQIRTQDNRATDKPLFAVMEKREIVAHEDYDHDRICWHETKSGEYCEATETQARRLEALHDDCRDTPGWERLAVKEIDVFVTACFTEQGCKDFLARDGHNHRKPFIYAYGSYRNAEYQAVRNYLAALPAPVGEA